MKQFLSLSIFVCMFVHVSAQAVFTNLPTAASTKSILDFGAIPDDGIDDSWAFIKAGKYFSNLWDINGQPTGTPNFNSTLYSAELTIPSGTYNVGKQYLLSNACTGGTVSYATIFGLTGVTTASITIPAGFSYKLGLELIVLNNVNQMKIKGTGLTAPVIKYNDSLDIGYFDCNGVAQFFHENGSGNPYSAYYMTTVGNFIQTTGCKNISIENMEVDGNNPTTVTNYDGGWDLSLIQAGATAVHNVDTKNVTIKDMNIHNMSLDGIVIDDFYKDTIAFPGQAASNFLVENTNCDFNRRQGLSWVGGRNINVTGCTFNNTGKLFSGISSGNPAAGLDIEPEDDGTNPLMCFDGHFTNCSFINNVGLAMGNDPGYSAKTHNMNFTNCTFHDVDTYAVLPGGRAFTFTGCNIWGTMLSGGAGTLPGDETIFNNCDFQDKEIVGQPGVFFTSGSLVVSDGIEKRMRFNGCTFEAIHPAKNLFTLNPNATTEAEFSVFSNCTFTMGSANTDASGNYFGECTFDGNNSFINNNTSYANVISTNGLVFTGNNDPCNPSVFSIKGKLVLWNANSNLSGFTEFIIGRNGIGTSAMDGYVDFKIDNEACLYTSFGQTIGLGSHARFINKTGGQFAALNTTFNNAGKIILDAGSNTAMFYAISFNTALTGQPEFYYHKNALTGLSTFWNSTFPFIGFGAGYPLSSMTFSANTIIDGGNSLVPSGYAGTTNEALSFDGVNDYVNLTTITSKISGLTNGNFSVEASFKKQAVTAGTRCPIFSQGGDDFAFGLNDAGYIYYKFPTAGAPTLVTLTTNAVTDNTCHYVVLTHASDNKIRIYLDKILIHTSVSTYINSVVTAMPSKIGRENYTSGLQKLVFYFHGTIGQVRLWTKELSAAEVCYNSAWKAPSGTTDLIADWDMTDASGTTLTDEIAPAVNGTLTNGPTWVTQNTIGDCVDAAGDNNGGYNNDRTSSGAPVIIQIMGEKKTGNDATILISPNPNNGTFTLQADKLVSSKPVAELYDVNGRIVWKEVYTVHDKQQFIKQIKLVAVKGIYILKLKDGEKVYSSKVVIL